MAYTNFHPKDNFSCKLYTGNGANNNAITSVGFKSDFTWIKARANTYDHMIFDSLRGTASLRENIRSNNNDASDNDASNMKTFDSDGFTLNLGGYVNNAVPFVSWNWRGGTTSGITAGSQTITPSAYSINAAAGFGVYKWSRSGASTTDYFSHGLGTTPTIAIQKRLDGAQDWYVNYTVVDGSNDYMNLNKVDDYQNDSTTVATSTNYYPKSPETGDYVTYLFSSRAGHIKCGSYLGNGETTYGSFITTGFKPNFLLVKGHDVNDNWSIFDGKREGYNTVNEVMYPDLTNTESNGLPVSFHANGFKWNTGAAMVNGSGSTFVYIAIASESLVSLNNIPATAY